MVLETLFETPDGIAAVIDFMSIAPSHLIRIVEGRRGTVAFRCDCLPRFDYGRVAADAVHRGRDIVMGELTLRSDVPLSAGAGGARGGFTAAAGQSAAFVLSHGTDAAPDAVRARTDALRWWRAWSDRCTYDGRWRAPVRRSLLTLKALTYRPSGGMVAAPSTSLPERIGGSRNWDYRFCWPRDSGLAARVFAASGHRQEADAWRAWLARAAAQGLRAIHGVAGEPVPAEREIPWLAGHAASPPVRIGNGAAAQRQWDMFGEIELGFEGSPAHWDTRRALIEHLETVWREPDEGIWEIRDRPRQFVFSKLMIWVALDRAIRTAETHGLAAPLDRWRPLRDAVHGLICARGFCPEIGSFTQVLDGRALDASLLLMPLVGFLPPDDRRIAGTVAAIGRGLAVDGMVRRYDSPDGLPAGEGVFLPCCFWYASALALTGRRAEAAALFEKLLALCNDVGLLAEEYDPAARRHLGNFPQALSHLALIETALILDGPGARQSGKCFAM